MKQVLVIGGGTGLTAAWLLENQGIGVTLVDKNDRLGGHIDTRHYRCIPQMLSSQPTQAQINQVLSLTHLLFIRHPDGFEIGFCDKSGNYQQQKITDPVLEAFLNKQPDGEFVIPVDDKTVNYIEQFNDLLRQASSCQRVTTYLIETGAEFIGERKSYPLFHTICDALNVKRNNYQLSMQVDYPGSPSVVLPPSSRQPSSQQPSSFAWLYRMFSQTPAPAPDSRFHQIWNEFKDLLDTGLVMIDADQTLNDSNQSMTLNTFVHLFVSKGGNEQIKKERQHFADVFLYPVMAASWGVPLEKIEEFVAHYTMNYLSLGETWVDIPEGLNTYIENMRKQCSAADIRLNTEIKKLDAFSTDAGLKYKAKLEDGSYLKSRDGEDLLFDDVIIATDGKISHDLLPDTPELADLKATLGKVDYYPTKIVIHRDPDKKYLSDHASVVHTHVEEKDGIKIAANTVCKYYKFDCETGEVPIMRTWVLEGQDDPKNSIDVIPFSHPYINQDYYQAQGALHHAQGQHGLYFGGIIAGFNDSHESGISAAIRAADMIYEKYNTLQAASACTENRFKLFSDYLQHLDQLDAQSSQLGAHEPALSLSA